MPCNLIRLAAPSTASAFSEAMSVALTAARQNLDKVDTEISRLTHKRGIHLDAGSGGG
jgi:hypothetical protein